MSNFFKFALVAALLVVGGCMSFEGGEGSSEDATPKELEYEVLEFLPAPGQFVNEGYSATTMVEACAYAEGRFRNRYFVSLGGFGGYIVVRFKTPILNSEGDYDFGIYGYFHKGNSEPGIVWVSQDANGNGLADDEWFELYGSESDKETTKHNYSITYSRTDDNAQIVWRDSEGVSGTIERNSFHSQDYYPAWVVANEYTLTGTLLPDNSEWSEKNREWVLHAFEWGYADSFSEIDITTDNANRFRISDAHTASGEPANLAHIDFIKVQSATNVIHPAIGEVSTEVSGFVSYNSVE